MARAGPVPSAPFADAVRLGDRSTEIRVGSGCRGLLRELLRSLFPGAERHGLVVDAGVEASWSGGGIPEAPGSAAGPVVVVPGGEEAKERRVLEGLQDRLLDLRRHEPVVAVGGGAVLDVAGFAAATVRRGLPWVALPTTTLAMADAAVGGKVAVNHPRGKNLLGAFHPPVLVLADPDYLRTLPARDRVAGLAEAYKAGRVGDGALLALLRRGPPRDEAAWTEAIRRAVAVKARLVETDERDAGARRLLNYGHTVGHALETALGNEALRHGEAVAIGMGVAARIAAGRGLATAAFAAAQAEDLARLGLPVAVPRAAPADRVLEVLGMDKKRGPGARHTFVLPVGEVVRVFDDVTEDEVRRALGDAAEGATA
jgi:3-dehydroquinate synthase